MRVTASKVALMSSCSWWARPEAEWANVTSAAADKGTRFHAAIAYYIATGEFQLTGTDEDVVTLCEVAQAWVDSFGRDKLAAEVAYAWNPATDTAEVIGHDIGRAYGPWQVKGLVCGSADIIAVSRHTKTGYVGDWSTGDGSRKGPQLRMLALMLARAEGLESVTVEALEVSAEGVRHVCRKTLDAFDLAAVAGEYAESIRGMANEEPNPGPHCGELYCPSRATCPAVRERVAEIIPAIELTRHRWGLTIDDADHAAWLYGQAKAVESAARLVKDAVKAYTPKSGLLLSDGSILIEGERNMPRTDHARVVSLARSLGATDEQLEACQYVAVESSGLRVKKAAKSRRSAA